MLLNNDGGCDSALIDTSAGCRPLGKAPAAVVKQEPAGPSGEAQAATPGAAKARPAGESAEGAAPAETRELLPKTPVSQIRAAFKQEQMMTPGPTPSPFTWVTRLYPAVLMVPSWH